MRDAIRHDAALDVPLHDVVPYAISSGAAGNITGTPATLPRDHPAWQRDILAISARARAIVAQLRPIVVRVLTFWDHAVRGVTLGHRRIDVDPSGSYRLR